MERTSPWVLFGAAILVPLGILAIGFRISYDSVIPEVLGLAVTGADCSFGTRVSGDSNGRARRPVRTASQGRPS